MSLPGIKEASEFGITFPCSHISSCPLPRRRALCPHCRTPQTRLGFHAFCIAVSLTGEVCCLLLRCFRLKAVVEGFISATRPPPQVARLSPSIILLFPSLQTCGASRSSEHTPSAQSPANSKKMPIPVFDPEWKCAPTLLVSFFHRGSGGIGAAEKAADSWSVPRAVTCKWGVAGSASQEHMVGQRGCSPAERGHPELRPAAGGVLSPPSPNT